MSEGWISIHRSLQSHWLWTDKPFDKRSAWLDLLLMVNHEDSKILLGNELVEVKRGSRITSIRQLCDRWGWSNTKVKNFLNILENDNMIVVKSDTKKTTLTIVNYNDYQRNKDDENDTQATGKRQVSDSEATRKHTNNNDNNDNNKYSAYFEEVWKLYPNKKGKAQVSTTKKKELYKLGDEFKRCISRYIDHVEEQRKNGFKELKYQNGSTFFNSGYVDYLDENFKDEEMKEPTEPFVPKFVYYDL